MLSTSSRSRHNLPILYVYTLFLSNAILSSFVTFRFVCMCVFLFSFRASIFPSKSLAGAPRASPSNDSVIFPLVSVRTLDGRVPDCPEIGRANVANKNAFYSFAAERRGSTNRATGQFLVSYRVAVIRARTPRVAFPFLETRHEQSLREHLQRPALDVRPREGIPRDVFVLIA